MTTQNSARNQGFTIIEVLITIVVAGIFIISIYQLYISVISISVAANRQTVASNAAYSNMRNYADGHKPLWFDCHKVASTPDYIVYQTTASIDGLPDPVHQIVRASAPYDCGTIGMPVRVESTVIFGSDKKEVTHAIYTAV